MVARNITKKSQILSTPINGDMPQNLKMSKRIIGDIAHHHKLIQVIILMHSMCHTPLIKSHHHLSKPLIHSYKIVQPHLPASHVKIFHHLMIPQQKISSTIHTNHKIHSTIHKIHSMPLKTSQQYIHAHKNTLNIHPLS
ncbi:hypothetical protein AHAS_Ahas19G0175800 [Arachis hypogaea]